MRKIVLDLETKNIFADVGKNDPVLLDVSLVGIYDSETNLYSSYLQEEFPLLWPLIERADILIGFNSDYFDIPLLNKYYPGDLTKIPSIDLLTEIKKALGHRVKLDSVAEATLEKKKSGHGLQAVEWWKKGDIENLRKYCLDDVKITKELYDYALAHGSLKYKDWSNIREIKLDTSLWEKTDKAGMTYSLPF
ncbi:MAG: ribonuclease H-like domain-containing protein [bacterium]|nr:ribonuclease H-like domain-containing protein [bacterium]